MADDNIRTCTKCSLAKGLSEFSSNRASCRECHRAISRAWKKTHDYKSASTRYYQRLRSATLEVYGGKCVCCGIDEPKFLAFDHIHNNGSVSRKAKESGIRNIAHWIRKNNYPNTIQILCHNCNLAKGFYGKCPHQD